MTDTTSSSLDPATSSSDPVNVSPDPATSTTGSMLDQILNTTSATNNQIKTIKQVVPNTNMIKLGKTTMNENNLKRLYQNQMVRNFMMGSGTHGEVVKLPNGTLDKWNVEVFPRKFGIADEKNSMKDNAIIWVDCHAMPVANDTTSFQIYAVCKKRFGSKDEKQVKTTAVDRCVYMAQRKTSTDLPTPAATVESFTNSNGLMGVSSKTNIMVEQFLNIPRDVADSNRLIRKKHKQHQEIMDGLWNQLHSKHNSYKSA